MDAPRNQAFFFFFYHHNQHWRYLIGILNVKGHFKSFTIILNLVGPGVPNPFLLGLVGWTLPFSIGPRFPPFPSSRARPFWAVAWRRDCLSWNWLRVATAGETKFGVPGTQDPGTGFQGPIGKGRFRWALLVWSRNCSGNGLFFKSGSINLFY